MADDQNDWSVHSTDRNEKTRESEEQKKGKKGGKSSNQNVTNDAAGRDSDEFMEEQFVLILNKIFKGSEKFMRKTQGKKGRKGGKSSKRSSEKTGYENPERISDTY